MQSAKWVDKIVYGKNKALKKSRKKIALARAKSVVKLKKYVES